MLWIAMLALSTSQDLSADELRKKLDGARVSVVDGTLDEALGALGRALGVSVYVDPRVLRKVDPARKIPLRLKDVSGSTAFYWVAKVRGLDWFIQDGMVVLTDPEHRQSHVQRFFDVGGIPAPPPASPTVRLDFGGPQDAFRVAPVPAAGGPGKASEELRNVLASLIAPQSPEPVRRALERMENGSGGTVDHAILQLIVSAAPKEAQDSLREAVSQLAARAESPSAGRPEELIDLLKTVIAPGSWEGDRTAEIGPRGNLIVTHAPAVLDEIDRFLTLLRRMAPPPVRVVAIVLDDAGLDAADARRAFLDVEQTRALLGRARALDRMGFTCLEGEDAHAVSRSSDSSSVLKVRAAVDASGNMIQVRLDAQTGFRAADPGERSIARFATTVLIPNGGSTLFRLPGRRALLLTAQADAGDAPREAELADVEDPDAAALRQKLAAAPPVDVDFKQTRLTEVVDFFRQATGLNFVINPASIDAPEQEPVTFQAKGVRPAAALAMILRPRQKTLIPDREAFRVDLLSHSSRLGLLLMSLRHVEGGLYTPDDFANLIKNTVEKDRWEEADGKSIVAAGGGLLLVKNDAEVLGKVRRFVVELGRRETIVTLEAEQIVVDAAKGRVALGGAGSLLKEEEARRLASAEGAVSERATLRGPDGRALALEWQAARSKAGFLQVASQLKAEARALPRGVHVSLQLRDQRFVPGPDAERPGIADAELRTSLLVPPDRVALFELPSSDGKAVYLLLRAAASSP